MAARRGRHAPARQNDEIKCQDNHLGDDFYVFCLYVRDGFECVLGGPTCLKTSFEASPVCMKCFGMNLRIYRNVTFHHNFHDILCVWYELF